MHNESNSGKPFEAEENYVKELLNHSQSQAAERLRLDADTFPEFRHMVEDLYYHNNPEHGSHVILSPIYRPPHGISLGKEVVVWDQHRTSERVAIIDPYGNSHSYRYRK